MQNEHALEVWADVQAIRENAPLVHNITNYVVMNITANALLALGASPVMAHAAEEVRDMTHIAGALVVNMGTLSHDWVESMKLAMEHALAIETPVVFDPVGSGATPYRTETAHALLDTGAVSLIRGNASEIMSLVDDDVVTKGVDSSADSDSAFEAARKLATKYDCAVCISGETDYIVTKVWHAKIYNGNPMLPKVTGLGCVATALCGAFLAVNLSPSHAAAHAMAVMGVAGEMAVEKADGPGTLQLHFLDALYNLTVEDLEERLRMETCA